MADVGRMTGDPVGMHRVLEPLGVLPQAAQRLDTDPASATTRCACASSG